MGLAFPWSVEELLAGIMELLKQEPTGTQYVRPIAFRGGPELWVTGSEGRPVDVSIFTVRTEQHRNIDAPISCELSSVERISSRSIPPQIKVSGAYVNSFLARKIAEKSGYDDGLMFDREGHLTEASAANVFLVNNDRLITPRLKPDVFPGITRQVVLEIARDRGNRCARGRASVQGLGWRGGCLRLLHPHGNSRDIKARRSFTAYPRAAAFPNSSIGISHPYASIALLLHPGCFDGGNSANPEELRQGDLPVLAFATFGGPCDRLHQIIPAGVAAEALAISAPRIGFARAFFSCPS